MDLSFVLVLNNDATWNKETANFYKDNGDAYGFTEEMANDICKRISSGESIKRIALHDGIPRDYYSTLMTMKTGK